MAVNGSGDMRLMSPLLLTLKIDVLSKDVICFAKDVDIGVAAKKALATCKLSEKEIMTFRM